MVEDMSRNDTEPHHPDIRATLIVVVITGMALLAASAVRALADRPCAFGPHQESMDQ
jgi:hypothetical protein